LLLGSGVSRSSAILTGWEVVLDLIRQLAHLKGEISAPDPETWYKKLTGSEPNYSDILDQLTQSSAERGLLLRSYFEPNEEDRQQGRKVPSPAHRAIAGLVAKGYVRVIVTTNFDRLMEQALGEAGVQASVISTPDAVQSALPLTHSPCTIIKIHGDYLDSRLRNTKPELSAYEKPFDDLLDQVFDEFGMVVCGWSAEWDVALRAAIERCSARRFGTYWTTHNGKLTGQAEKLIGLRRATVLTITGADAFFQDLSEKIGALEDLTLSDPMPARVAVARMKRYLTSPDQRINLHDLVKGETERVYAGISGDRFSAKGQNISPEVTLRRLRDYEAELNVLLPIVACGGYWATEAHFSILCRAVKRIADDYADQNGLIVWLRLHRYPALLTLYTMGIAAVANNNYGLLTHLLALQIRTDKHHPEESIIEPFSPSGVLDRKYQQQLLPGRDLEFTPLGNHVFAALRDPLRDYLSDENAYDDAFDWFEYLIGLVHCDLAATPEEIDRVKIGPQNGHIRGPVGRFIWNKRTSDMAVQGRTLFEPGGPCPEVVTAVLQAGFFGSVGSHGSQLNYERFLLIKRGFDAHIALVRSRMGVW
jgi:hypothetical protein